MGVEDRSTSRAGKEENPHTESHKFKRRMKESSVIWKCGSDDRDEGAVLPWRRQARLFRELSRSNEMFSDTPPTPGSIDGSDEVLSYDRDHEQAGLTC